MSTMWPYEPNPNNSPPEEPFKNRATRRAEKKAKK